VMARSKILLDEVMPVYEFSDAQSILIHASPQQIWHAFNAITLAEIPVMRPLFWLRTLPARLSGTRPVELPETQPFNELALGPESPWILLAEQPEHELVMEAIGIFAQLKIEFVPIRDFEEFVHFTNPKYSKTVLGFRIADGEPATGHVVTMESRTQVPDPSMRRRFAIYCRKVRRSSSR
jgi:hypothetical protein